MARIIWIVLFIFLGLTVAYGQSSTSPQIHYMGFNQFKEDHSGANEKIFDGYVNALAPIMERYGLTLETYRVIHEDSDPMGADAITFGTAPDQDSFVAFFADPDFQALFPTLVEIIQNHTVIFTPEPFAPSLGDNGDSLLLSAAWLVGEREESYVTLLNMESETAEARRRYGVALIKRSQGITANRGLAADIEVVAPPDVLALWNLADPHGYYDDPAAIKFSKKANPYFKDTATFWLEPW